MKKYKISEYIEELKKYKLLIEENIEETLKNKEVEKLTYDSREVNNGTLFVCKGNNFKKE